MAVYDLEEQEQLDDLKAWWARWGNTIATALVIACVIAAAVQGWRWWTYRQSEDAAVLFSAVAQAARANDISKAKDATAQLTDKYSGTGYAPRAAFLLAKMQFDAGDTAAARAQFQWIVDHADEPELKEISRYRLAELLLNDKQYGEALKVLDAKHGDPFTGLYADLRGDAYAAAGRGPEARAAYQEALAKFDAKSPYRNYVQVKLDALGGALPDTAAAAPAPAASPQPAAPAPTAAQAVAPTQPAAPAQPASTGKQ